MTTLIYALYQKKVTKTWLSQTAIRDKDTERNRKII